MTVAPPPPGDRSGGTDRAARRAWWIAAVGTAALGGGTAAVSAAGGATGRHGLAVLLLGALLSCAAGALYAVVSGAVDALRGRRVGRGRVVAAGVLGLLALVLPAMIVGVAA